MVLTINDIAYGAYHLVNVYLLDLCERDPSMIPRSLKQNFFAQACGHVSKIYKRRPKKLQKPLFPDAIIQKFLQTLPNNFMLPPKDQMNSLINNLAREMLTVSKNHFNTNFDQRLSIHIRDFYGIRDQWKRSYIVERVFMRKDKDTESKFKGDSETELLIQSLAKELNYPNQDTVISNNLDVFVPFLWKIKKIQEFKRCIAPIRGSENGRKIGKAFSLLPLKRSFIPSHINICSKSLGEMLRATGNLSDRRNNVAFYKTLWDRFFKISNYTTRKRHFGYSISTNGYEVAIRLDAPGACSHSNREAFITKTNANGNQGREFEKCVICGKFLGFTDEKKVAKKLEKNNEPSAFS